ncbi:restriction endonuclease subunit S [Mycoplasma sp. Z707]|uniref:restriction endonuclease subunit S n=1 Tax=Mycoplasma sp. Z707 TaxID=3401691 RepID=UPI003AAB694A
MLDKKMAPEIRFKGFNAEWEIAVLSDFIDYERPDKYIEKLPLLEFGQIPVLTANKSFKLGYTESQNYYTKGDCILFDDFTLDSKYVDFPFMVVSSALKILSLKNSQDSLPYYFGILKNNTFESQGHARHYISIVAKTPIKISNSIEERNLIGSFFTYTDSLIQFQDQKLKKLQTIKQSLLNKMFASFNQKMPEIRFKGFEENFEVIRLNEIAEYKNGKGHEKFALEKGKYILVNSKFISSNASQCKHTNINISPLFKDDIVMVLSDIPGGKALAKTFLIDNDNKYALNQRICALTSKSTLPIYLNIILNRNSQLLVLDDHVNQTNINRQQVMDLLLLIPSYPEQQKIGQFFSSLDSLIHYQEQKLEKLNNMKQALLEKMFC